MATYMLCGKDAEGRNAVQRGEIYLGNNTRYNSYRRKDDRNKSLDAMLALPLADEAALKPATEKHHYKTPKPQIRRPHYNKKTGELLDPGDSDIPGMTELWERIDYFEHWIAVLEGKTPANPDDLLFDNSYRLYQLKHQLIDLRRHQYYLRDAYKPPIYMPGADHPRPQFYDWTSDAYYWIAREEWQDRVDHALTSRISKNIADYETRNGGTEVKWVVRQHTFNWEDHLHVRALMNNYEALESAAAHKIDTYAKTLLMDFERYRDMANFSPLRLYILQARQNHYTVDETATLVFEKFSVNYGAANIDKILSNEIPKQIARAALLNRLAADTPRKYWKHCCRCKELKPRNLYFFSSNATRRDGYASACKVCDKKRRIERGEQLAYDQRTKDTTLREMQARQAGI